VESLKRIAEHGVVVAIPRHDRHTVKPEVGNLRPAGMLAFRAADRVISNPSFALGPMLVCCSTRAVVCSCGLFVPESRGKHYVQRVESARIEAE
jgi:hypothetical protein